MDTVRRLARTALAAALRMTWKVRNRLRERKVLASIPDEADYHLGCGEHRIAGRVNIDVRAPVQAPPRSG
jgi:hypothetical protein